MIMHEIFAAGHLTLAWLGEDCLEMQRFGSLLKITGGRSTNYRKQMPSGIVVGRNDHRMEEIRLRYTSLLDFKTDIYDALRFMLSSAWVLLLFMVIASTILTRRSSRELGYFKRASAQVDLHS